MYDSVAKQVIISRLIQLNFKVGPRSTGTVYLTIAGKNFMFELDPSVQSHEAIEEAIFELDKQIRAAFGDV